MNNYDELIEELEAEQAELLKKLNEMISDEMDVANISYIRGELAMITKIIRYLSNK